MEPLNNLMQWLNNGGSLEIKSHDIGQVFVRLGDPGGYPPDWAKECNSPQSALAWAEQQAARAIESSKEQLEWYKNGEIEWPEEGYVKIPGLGIIHKSEIQNGT